MGLRVAKGLWGSSEDRGYDIIYPMTNNMNFLKNKSADGDVSLNAGSNDL